MTSASSEIENTMVDIQPYKAIGDTYKKLEVDMYHAYHNLLTQELEHAEQIGQQIPYYNNAERIDTFRDRHSHIVKEPEKFGIVLKFLREKLHLNPSHGIKIKEKSSPANYVHMLLEYENGASIGVFYHDLGRPLSVREIFNAEEAVIKANLDGGLIISNSIGYPAREAAERINKSAGPEGLLKVVQLSQIINELE